MSSWHVPNSSHLSQRAGVAVKSDMVVIYTHEAVKNKDGFTPVIFIVRPGWSAPSGIQSSHIKMPQKSKTLEIVSFSKVTISVSFQKKKKKKKEWAPEDPEEGRKKLNTLKKNTTQYTSMCVIMQK